MASMQSTMTIVTYDDYLTLPSDGKRYEIIEGGLYMTPAPTTEHQEISFRLERLLHEYVSRHECGYIYHSPVDVVLSMTDVVQPDIIFISHERKEIITKRNIVAAPDFIIEIVSESSAAMDRVTKKALYEKYGVKEYWIIDPEKKRIECYALKENKFSSVGVYNEPETFMSHLLSGLTITLRDVFATSIK